MPKLSRLPLRDHRAHETEEIVQLPADPLLAAELADDDLIEMAHLTTTQPSFSVTISDSTVVIANSLPVRVVRQTSPQVIEWVARKDAL